MAERQFYDSVGLLEEVRRYKTSHAFLDLLFTHFNGIDSLVADGPGPRLMTVSSALPNEFYGIDVNPGSIKRAKEFIKTWRNYVDEEPFKTEFGFLKEKGLKPNFENCHLFLLEDFPPAKDYFDGELASELFLHLPPEEVRKILSASNQRLVRKGKMVFTVYTSGAQDSLDECFMKLGSKAGMKRKDFIKDGVVDIFKLAARLKEKAHDVYEQNKQKFWLDLERVRVFNQSDIESLCRDSGFNICDRQAIKCGMFSFAHRLVYVLIK